MRRYLVGAVALIWLAVELVQGSTAGAQRGRSKQRRPAREQVVPHSEKISEAMGDITWGLSPRAIADKFTKKIREDYQPRLTKAPGAVEEDRLRHEMGEELRRVREGYVRFDGTATGWDVSFLRDEYTHRNNEAMLVVRDGNSQNFYFFINDRLWKWYKAFNAEVFAGQPFAQFAVALQQRFGPAREKTGTLREGGSEKHWLEWQDRTTRLRAIDENRFYGFYCLVFEEKATVDRLAELRTNPPPNRETRHSVVQSVTAPQNDTADPDVNPDIVDRITGQIRNRQQAPETPQNRPTKAGRQAPSRERGAASAQKNRNRDPESDSLQGLDL